MTNQDDSPILMCDGLSKLFIAAGDLQIKAVNSASLRLREHEVVVVHGSSGSGKTTLLMMLAGMLQPTSGSIQLFNRDLYGQSVSQRTRLRRDQIGVVLPMFHLLPYLDAAANVALGYGRKQGRARALELLDRLGLADRAKQLPDRMSAGERRRLLVARALIHQPRLLLADEPTSNLDEENGAIIQQLLIEHARAGNGVLIVTHEDPRRFKADSVYRMSAGSLNLQAK